MISLANMMLSQVTLLWEVQTSSNPNLSHNRQCLDMCGNPKTNPKASERSIAFDIFTNIVSCISCFFFNFMSSSYATVELLKQSS